MLTSCIVHPDWAQRVVLLLASYHSLLAKLFNAIEAGAPWPETATHIRGASLPKDEDRLQDPLAYRVIKVADNNLLACVQNRRHIAWLTGNN